MTKPSLPNPAITTKDDKTTTPTFISIYLYTKRRNETTTNCGINNSSCRGNAVKFNNLLLCLWIERTNGKKLKLIKRFECVRIEKLVDGRKRRLAGGGQGKP